MVAPALNVARQGLGSVNADNLNTAEQTCDNLAQLRAFIGIQGVQVFLRGYVTLNDGGQGPFVWISTATGPDNGTSIIIPTGVTVGAWVRINLLANLSTGLILTWTGNQTTASTWLGGESAEVSYLIPQNLPGSTGVRPKTLPTANYTVAIKVNGSTIATATSAASDGSWTLACASDVTVLVDDDVDFIGPGDVTIADFGLTIKVRVL